MAKLVGVLLCRKRGQAIIASSATFRASAMGRKVQQLPQRNRPTTRKDSQKLLKSDRRHLALLLVWVAQLTDIRTGSSQKGTLGNERRRSRPICYATWIAL